MRARSAVGKGSPGRFLLLLAAASLMAGCGVQGSRAPSSRPPGRRASSTSRAPGATASAGLQAIAMTTPRAGAAISLSMLYQTDNAGHTWVPVHPVGSHSRLSAGPDGRLLLVSLTMSSDSRLQITTGVLAPGESWRFESAPLPRSTRAGEGYPELRCSIRTDKTLWCLDTLAGGTGLDATQLWETVNGGASWTALGEGDTPAGTTTLGIKGTAVATTSIDGWLPASTLVTVSGAPESPVLYQTADGGATWTPASVPAPRFSGTPGTWQLNAPIPVPNSAAWVTVASAENAAATVTRLSVLSAPTANGQWARTGQPILMRGVPPVVRLFAAGSRVWWLWTGQRLYRTVNAARTWAAMPLPPRLAASILSGRVSSCADFVGPRTGFVLLQSPSGPGVLWEFARGGWSAFSPRLLARS